MKNRFVPAMPEGLARACPPGLVAVLMAGVLSACGGGGGGGTPPPTATLSADQKIYEDAALHGGIGGISYNVPYGGGVLASGNSFVYSTLTTLSASPLASGSQTVTPRLATVAPSLTPPSPQKSWYLVGGQFVARSTTANEQVSYDGTAVQVVRYADDNQTIVDGFHEDAFREVALSGSVSSAPAELLGVLPLDQWAAGGNFSAATPWQPGAFYVARKETLTADRTLLEACYPLANLATASTATMPPPCFSGSLASRFPLTLYFPASSHPRETYAAADGTVSTLQGLQVWTANQPEPSGGYPTRSYRVFIHQGGAIYAGVMQRQGTAATSTLSDGSVVGEVFALNQAAISTVGQGVVLTPSTPRQTAGILRGLPTLDLYGIGGTGVNGALSPQDLRTHYDVPPALDGTGQTIAVVDSPGPSWIDYIDDLQAYSRAFGLPVCASAAGSCFQHVDLSNGAFAGTGNGGATEATLDIEMVHAMAPGANIVLVTAASGSLADMMAAVNYAASLPQVTAVSASWGYDYAATVGTIPDEEFLLAQFVAQGKVFFASSGDAGQLPGFGPTYPAISTYFTSVGGTRIQAVAPSAGASSDTGWLFSGGGATPWMAMPSWQQAFVGSSQVLVNTDERAVPDVTAVADPAHSPVAMYFRQRWTMEGGTSVGAPLWAGIAALIAQQKAAAGTSLAASVAAAPGGFNGLLYRGNLFATANPALEALAGGTSFAQEVSCGSCSVVPGYNDVAGLGTPDVASLIAAF
ncbi:MAG: S53 family peptidase [Caulobacter sp.]|nr:S53 family peptidase [Vitreoscilla sp.]